MWSELKMNFWGGIDKAFWVNLIRRKYSAVFGCSLYQKKEFSSNRTQKSGDKELKTARRHNKVVKIYDNSFWCHLKSVDIKSKWHPVFDFQFALLTCLESDFDDDAHKCHPFMIISHLWCQIFCPSLSVNKFLLVFFFDFWFTLFMFWLPTVFSAQNQPFYIHGWNHRLCDRLLLYWFWASSKKL